MERGQESSLNISPKPKHSRLIYRRRHVRDVPAYFTRTIPRTSLSLPSVILFFRKQSVFAISEAREHIRRRVVRMYRWHEVKKSEGKTTDMGD